jgi:choline dehydrogenase
VSVQWRLNQRRGYNHTLRTPVRQALTAAHYLATRRGVLALPAYDLLAFCKSRPELERPDGMFLFSPLSIEKHVPMAEALPEAQPGASCAGCILRPESLGSTHIASSDPYANPAIDPGYLSCAEDRRAAAGLVRRMRELVSDGPLADYIAHETFPGPEYETDDALADHVLVHGNTGYHSVGTCSMGPADSDVVDHSLRVRGVDGLRLVDASICPVMPASNTNAPVMAMAWHAADVIMGRSSAAPSATDPIAA